MPTFRLIPGPAVRAALLLCLSALALPGCLAGCGSDAPGGPDAGASCTKSSQCAAGEGCISNHCTPLPCGGCQPDEVCQDSGTCAPAQGAGCPSAGCPAGYTCNNNHVCSKPCAVDRDCGDPKLVCNPNSGTCAQCVFDSNCASVTGKPRCDATSGNCVACLQPIDCTSALGSGHYCDPTTHACAAGCKVNGDCNLANGERCDGATATTPGKCIQCTVATEGTDCNVAAPACDSNGKCVICTADKYCNPATPRCEPTSKTCVQCLPVHNATGEDCGYQFTGSPQPPKDPHNALTCDSAAKQCVAGCAGESQCGCPIDPATKKPTNCSRRYLGEHCDPALTAMPNIAGKAEGGCVECVANLDCHCKVKGSTAATPGCDANWPKLGGLNGARCVKDTADNNFGKCQEGCDTNADCPSGRLCSLSGSTAHTCVECSCASPAGNGPDANWCNDVADGNHLGGCGLKNSGQQVCDVHTLTCRLKRQSELCVASLECGDTLDPTVGQCIPGAKFCIKSAHAYSPGSPEKNCAAGAANGRCGVACNDPQNNFCDSGNGIACPSQSHCEQATAFDQPPTGPNVGQYCVSTACTF